MGTGTSEALLWDTVDHAVTRFAAGPGTRVEEQDRVAGHQRELERDRLKEEHRVAEHGRELEKSNLAEDHRGAAHQREVELIRLHREGETANAHHNHLFHNNDTPQGNGQGFFSPHPSTTGSGVHTPLTSDAGDHRPLCTHCQSLGKSAETCKNHTTARCKKIPCAYCLQRRSKGVAMGDHTMTNHTADTCWRRIRDQRRGRPGVLGQGGFGGEVGGGPSTPGGAAEGGQTPLAGNADFVQFP